jgi:ribosomal protein S11
MHFTLIGALIILLSSSGCTSVAGPAGSATPSAAASTSPSAPRLADRSLALNEGRVQLNVRGGYFSQLESKSEKSATFALVLQRSNRIDNWAALTSVCVKGALPGKMACLRAIQRQPDVNLLNVEIGVGSETDVAPQITAIDGTFVIGEEILVKIDIGASDIRFEVNGKHKFTQAIDFETSKIRYGCSSAECIYTLL